MTCAVCRYYDVCIARNSQESCTHKNTHDPQRDAILGEW